MSKFLKVILFAVTVSSLAISSAPAQTKKADAKKADTNKTTAAQGKITKAEAERIVMQKNPGANVVNTTATTVNGHQVWSVSVTGTGGNAARKVFVDQETGKISR